MKRLFTLVELIIVIVVLGVLAVIVIPNISSMKEKSISTAITSDTKNIQTSLDMHQLENKDLPTINTVEFGNPQLIDFEKLIPKYLRDKPKQGYFWIDSNKIVYGADTFTPLNIKFSNGVLSWDGEGDNYQVFEVKNTVESNASKVEIIPIGEITNKKVMTGLDENHIYLVASQDKYGHWTPPVGENYVPTYYEGDEPDIPIIPDSEGAEMFTYEYREDEDSYEVSGFSDEYDGRTDLVFPNYYNNKEVISINAKSEFRNKGLTSVIIPDNIKEIHYLEFIDNDIKEVKLGKNAKFIWKDRVGTTVFRGSKVDSFEVHPENPYMKHSEGKDALYTKDGLTLIHGNILTPETNEYKNVTKIDGDAFYKQGLVGEITIPDGVTDIGSSAFEDNNLTNVIFNDKTKYISQSAFEKNKLKNLILPEELTSVGISAFSRNGIESVVFNDKLKTISQSSFSSNKIKEAIIPDSVTLIGRWAFNSNDIEILKLPSNIKKIEEHSFSSNKIKHVDLPETITQIKENAFYKNKLKTVKIPRGVTEIEDSVFYNNNLEEIIFHDNIKKIGVGSFYSNNLKEVILPEGLLEIAKEAFAYNNLSETIIPYNTYKIGDRAFASNNQGEIYILNNNAIIGEDLTWSVNSNMSTILYGFIGSTAETYANNTDNFDFQSIEDYYAWEFMNSNEEAKITKYNGYKGTAFIPKELEGKPVTEIGVDAFYNSYIEKLILPDTIKRIEYQSFTNNGLKELVLPINIRFIDDKSFYNFNGRNKLEKVTIYNPSLILGNEVFNEEVVIHGYKNSTAEQYANKHGNSFVEIK